MLGSFVVNTGSGGAPTGPSSGGHMFPSPVFGLKNVWGCFGLPGDCCDELRRGGLVVLLEAFLEDSLPSILPRLSRSRLPHNTSERCFLFKVFAVDDGLAAVE